MSKMNNTIFPQLSIFGGTKSRDFTPEILRFPEVAKHSMKPLIVVVLSSKYSFNTNSTV